MEAENFLKKFTDPSQTLIRLRGLPYSVTAEEIVGYFKFLYFVNHHTIIWFKRKWSAKRGWLSELWLLGIVHLLHPLSVFDLPLQLLDYPLLGRWKTDGSVRQDHVLALKPLQTMRRTFYVVGPSPVWDYKTVYFTHIRLIVTTFCKENFFLILLTNCDLNPFNGCKLPRNWAFIWKNYHFYAPGPYSAVGHCFSKECY